MSAEREQGTVINNAKRRLLSMFVFYFQTTLFLLMDHLCLVTAQSDRNKMTPQNLAICFGPVLMLHSADSSNQLEFQKPIGVLKYLLQIWPMKSGTGIRRIASV